MTSKPPSAFQASPPGKPVKEFCAELEASINHATKFRPYRKTSVIAFHWANDDIGVKPLEDQLLEVFRSIYGFETESFTIPLVNSQIDLLMHLLSWSQRNCGDDTLRIYVYSGHADSAGTLAHRWNLAGRYNPMSGIQGPTVDWWSIRGNLESLSGELCYIFDTCSAGSGALSAYNGAEFLAASAYEQQATASSTFSLTNVLADELRHLNGQPETLASLYGRMFRYAQQNQVGAPPVHIPKPNFPSVTIGRNHARPPVTRNKGQGSYEVLLSVRVRENIPLDLDQWRAWLAQNIPDGVQSTKVKIEAAFRGSSLLLFTVPVEVWTMLPANDPSYSFIGHVNSHIVVAQQSPFTATLPMHFPPPSGRENQPSRSPD